MREWKTPSPTLPAMSHRKRTSTPSSAQARSTKICPLRRWGERIRSSVVRVVSRISRLRSTRRGSQASITNAKNAFMKDKRNRRSFPTLWNAGKRQPTKCGVSVVVDITHDKSVGNSPDTQATSTTLPIAEGPRPRIIDCLPFVDGGLAGVCLQIWMPNLPTPITIGPPVPPKDTPIKTVTPSTWLYNRPTSLTPAKSLRRTLYPSPLSKAEVLQADIVHEGLLRAGSISSQGAVHTPKTPRKPPPRLPTPVNESHLRKVRVIAKSPLGRVFIARDAELGTTYAMKISETQHCFASVRAEKMRLSTEIRVLRSIRDFEAEGNVNPFLLQAAIKPKRWAWTTPSKNTCILTEHCPHGSLQTFKSSGTVLIEWRLRTIFAQLYIGITRLHTMNIIHRRIQLRHVFITKDRHCAIAGYGSAHTGPSVPSPLPTGTPLDRAYMAPEMLAAADGSLPYTSAVDWFALARTVVALRVGEDKMLEAIQPNGSLPESLLSGENGFPMDLRLLLVQMMDLSPARRPTPKQISEHPYFASIDWDGILGRHSVPFHSLELRPPRHSVTSEPESILPLKLSTGASVPWEESTSEV